MLKRTTVDTTSLVKQSDFAISQKARVAALEKAEKERAQKRRENDALLNVNASRWRFEIRQQP